MESNMYNFKEQIKKQIIESSEVKQKMLSKHVDVINDVTGEIIKAYQNNKKVIWFGNGGSAADAQHLSCELVSKFLMERKAIPSMSLTTNTSILTAVSNDYCFEDVFERQVEAFAEKGDILIGITTSGTSPNIIKAFKAGRKIGTINVAFTGKKTDQLRDYVDYLIDVPSKLVPRIQESQITVGHVICDLVEKTLFGD